MIQTLIHKTPVGVACHIAISSSTSDIIDEWISLNMNLLKKIQKSVKPGNLENFALDLIRASLQGIETATSIEIGTNKER